MALTGDLLPHRALAVMVGGDREGLQGLQVDLAGAAGIQQLRGGVAEAQPLLDQALGDAEARGDGGHDDAGASESREGGDLVGRVHGDAHDILGQREFARVAVGGDQTGHRPIGGKRAVFGERLERGEAAAAGDHGETLDPVVGFVGAGDQVLEQPVGGDGGLEFGQRGRVGRGLARILGRQREAVERDLPERGFGRGCGDHAGLPWDEGMAARGGPLRPVRARPGRARPRLPAARREGPGGSRRAAPRQGRFQVRCVRSPSTRRSPV